MVQYEKGDRRACVSKDPVTHMYVVKFYLNGNHYTNGDYISDQQDAEDTAKYWVGLVDVHGCTKT